MNLYLNVISATQNVNSNIVIQKKVINYSNEHFSPLTQIIKNMCQTPTKIFIHLYYNSFTIPRQQRHIISCYLCILNFNTMDNN